MKQTILLLLSTILFSNLSYSQEPTPPDPPASGSEVYEICDDNVETDGDSSNDSSEFNLNALDSEILESLEIQNQTDYTVSYFLEQTDADNNIDPIEPLYTNTVNPQEIYARVSENNSSNYEVITVDLMVNSLPDINFIGDLFICDSGSTTLVSTNLSEIDYSFEWFLNEAFLTSGTNNILIDQVGNYSLSVSNNTSGCESLSSFVIREVECALSIESFEDENLKMFPNPSNDLVTIQDINQISNISIFNVQGKQINLETIKKSLSELEFSVSNLENGIYFIKIQNEFKNRVMKLIVK